MGRIENFTDVTTKHSTPKSNRIGMTELLPFSPEPPSPRRSPMSDPAPPPCEACKTYLRSEPSHIAFNEWLKMFDEHHRIIAEKDARIRALEAEP